MLQVARVLAVGKKFLHDVVVLCYNDCSILQFFIRCVFLVSTSFVYIVSLQHQECEDPYLFILSTTCMCSEPCCVFIAFVVVVVVVVLH